MPEPAARSGAAAQGAELPWRKVRPGLGPGLERREALRERWKCRSKVRAGTDVQLGPRFGLGLCPSKGGKSQNSRCLWWEHPRTARPRRAGALCGAGAGAGSRGAARAALRQHPQVWGAVWGLRWGELQRGGSAPAGDEALPRRARLAPSSRRCRERAALRRLHLEWKLRSAVKQGQKSP